MDTVNETSEIKVYTLPESSKKYMALRKATQEEIDAALLRNPEVNLTLGKAVVIQEVYAPGGAFQGRLSSTAEIVCDVRELQAVQRIV